MAILMVDTQNFLNNTEKILKKKGIIKNTPKDKPKWDYFDFAGLFENVLKDFSISRNLFYTAKIVFYKETPEKSKELINRNRVLINHLQKQGKLEVIFGKMKMVRLKKVLMKKGLMLESQLIC